MAFEPLAPPPSNVSNWGWEWKKWLFNLWKWINNNVNKNFFFEVAKGNVTGHSVVHVLAFSSSNTLSTEYDVWPDASSNKTWRTTAATLEAISTSANDDGSPVGTGAHKVRVYGLDANFASITEDITLNGIAASTATTQSFIRVNRAVVIESGAYASGATAGSNIGVITIRVSGGGATECTIPAGVGISQNSHYTIPTGYKGYINRMMLNVDATKTAYFKLYVRENADDVTASVYTPRILVHEWPGITGVMEETTDTHYEISAKSDIWLTAIPGANNTVIHVSFEIILVAE